MGRWVIFLATVIMRAGFMRRNENDFFRSAKIVNAGAKAPSGLVPHAIWADTQSRGGEVGPKRTLNDFGPQEKVIFGNLVSGLGPF